MNDYSDYHFTDEEFGAMLTDRNFKCLSYEQEVAIMTRQPFRLEEQQFIAMVEYTEKRRQKSFTAYRLH